MKKIISLALAVVMILSMGMMMTGCGSEDGGEGLKVTAVLSTNLGDKSFNDSAKLGIDNLAAAGFDANVVECNANADLFEQNLRSAADAADLIIGVGSELDMIGAVANDYPDKKFVWVDNVMDDLASYPNLTCISYKQNEGSYLVGYVAGKMTESNVVGFIGGMDIPVINDFYVGYAQGAKDANPDVKVVKNYTGDWSDTNLGAECGQALAAQGADIIFCCGGGSGTGAILKAEELGIKCIGVDQDMRITMPDYADYIICSMIKDIGASIEGLVTAVAEDPEANWTGGEVFFAGMGEGYVGAAFGGPDQEVLVPQEIIDELAPIKEKVVNGELVVDTVL
jgi:basic membrane protein A